MKYMSLFLLLLLSIGCKNKSMDDSSPLPVLSEGYGSYLVEHTQSEISVADNLVFRFSGAVIEPEQIGNEVDPKLFKITPKVNGKAYWKDMSTLIFDPEEYFEYNARYDFTIQLSTIYKDVPERFRDATIPFRTRVLNLDLDFYKINYPPNDGDLIQYTGAIKSSDFIDNNEIEKMLSATQQGSDIELLWTHSSGRHHSFSISNIVRTKEGSEVNIKWDGRKWDSDFEGERKQIIFPKGIFQIISAEASKGENRSVFIDFTSPLDKRQSLEGLVRIKNYKGKLKYEINGSRLTVYPQSKVDSPFELILDKSIANKEEDGLKDEYIKSLSFDPIKPAVRLAGKGVIVPFNDEIIFPFEAINLKGAQVEVFKIFDDNVLQFLQYNRLNTTYDLQAVGRIIHQQKMKLSNLNIENNDASYVRYALDLRKLITPDPGAIYQVRIGFEKDDVIDYDCESDEVENKTLSERDGFTSIIESSINYDGYRWEDRNDPCKRGYYDSSNFITRNILGSNIGIIAKKGQNNNHYFVLSDLKSVEPIDGATVKLYDFQQQLITSGLTGSNGQLSIETEKEVSFGIVKSGLEFGYINLQDQHANSLSEFEVSGKSKKKGIDGYIYGERGVWRPGDTLFINFMLEDKLAKLPSNHPVTLTVKDARGKQKYTKTRTDNKGRLYSYAVPTDDADPTGNWTAIVSVGGSQFQKSLKVETVKPNRLKIKYDLDEDARLALYADQKVGLTSTWLHGAPGDGLRAKVDMQIMPSSTQFKGYDEYVFDDPARKIDPVPSTVFDGNLDESGKTSFSIMKNENWLAPGKLRANFKTKVFEKGGNFSEDNFSMDADIYASYVGVNMPKTRWGSRFIKSNTPTDIPLVVVGTDGKPIANRKLSIGIYSAEWNWWYDRGYSQKYNYNSAKHTGAILKDKVTTDANGKADFNVKFEDEYNNYMIRICDDVTGHCTGDMFYTGYSWGSQGSKDGPQQLLFTTDKKSYKVGESIEVKIPSNEGSKIFISIEKGEKVLQSFWIDGKKDETKVEILTDASMNSNVYIHAHLIQPHNNGANDLPIRMFGIVPISVIDDSSEINPKISMPESIRPNESFVVKVSEQNGKPMTYTLAVVDEGLLDLTRFKTPDPWNHFYAKQALGVKTWDIYDMVLDGYGGKLDRYISIGGDANSLGNKKGKKANRFVPVVRHLGPFTITAGASQSHKISMPNYVGSVRTMVVARNNNAYGNAEETTPVKKPLMLLATLPRVLGPNESLTLPANVFAMEDNIKNVKVSVETSDNLSISGSISQNLTFSKLGDKQAYFDMNVAGATGLAKVKMTVSGHGESAYDEVNIDIRNPNPYTSKVYEASVEPGQEWEMNYELFGTIGSNEGVLELSNMPPMNFGRRLKYLIRYPYGCVEQTTSSVFPQLYLDAVTELSDKRKYKIETNIRRGIERLSLFQTSGGGLGYWPGDNAVSEWGTNYAGHFLLEARDKGFYVPDHIIKGIVKYQDVAANNFDVSSVSKDHRWRGRTQAYRLYTLAKAGSPNIGAMNRLKVKDGLSAATAHMLAASYAIIGQKEVAKQLVANTNLEVSAYVETGNSYGSGVRDMAMMAEAHQVIGNTSETAQLIKRISQEMSTHRWYSTQTTAYSLLSIGKFLSAYVKDDLKYEYSTNGNEIVEGTSKKPTIQAAVEVESSANKIVKVKNTSSSIMYVRYVLSGQLPPGSDEKASSKHIKLAVSYQDKDGNHVNPKIIKQGTDFVAKVTVSNLGSRGRIINEVAISQIFPSGWEIQNDRMSSMSDANGNSRFDYRDIRDDRVYTFFDINGRNASYTYYVNLTAAYAGKFYLSPVAVEAMYDNEIQAKNEGMWVEVVK
jgi:uncharacterized protein YfaS (alpha-2-macroglobulin family)